MDITAFDIWFITRLDYLSKFCFITTCLVGFTTFIFGMVWFANFEGYSESAKKASALGLKYGIRSAISFVIFSLLWVCIPTTKIATAMYFIPKVMKSEVVQQLPAYAKQLMDKVLGVDINSVIKDTKEGLKQGAKDEVKEAKELKKELRDG